MNKRIRVSGVGCSLVDRLYNNISFTSATFIRYLTRNKNDGGLYLRHLIFKEEFETFYNKSFQSVLKDIAITNQSKAEKLNMGRPCIVAQIHAAQLSCDMNCDFSFYSYRGNDEDDYFLISSLKILR